MKKTLSLLLMLALSLSVSMARVPKKRFVTQVFTTDIVCHNCELKIMDNVAVLGKGVQDVQVNVETKEVTVTYDPKKTTEEDIISGFAKIKVKAEPKKSCCGGCKKAEGTEAKPEGCCKKAEGAAKKAETTEAKVEPKQGGCCKK